MKIDSIGIIGGTNGIGACFAEYWRNHLVDKDVFVSGRSTELTNEKLIEQVDLVIFAVPISVTAEVIEKLLPCSRTDQIWADFTSIKSPVMESLRKSKGEICAIHPIFGPMSDLKGQKLVLCPDRISDDSYENLKELFDAFDVSQMSVIEHDKAMGVIQNLTHLTNFVFGETLRRLDVGIDDLMKLSSPSYRIHVELLGRMFHQSSDLYAHIATENPYGAAFSQVFAESSQMMAQSIQDKKPLEIEACFRSIAAYLGSDFTKLAFETSDRLMSLENKLQKLKVDTDANNTRIQ